MLQTVIFSQLLIILQNILMYTNIQFNNFKGMIKQRIINSRQSIKDQLLKKPGYFSFALRRNNFISIDVSNSTLQINNPQYQHDSIFVTKKFHSIVLDKNQESKAFRKSSYQQYRQNRKIKIKQKWNGIVSQRKGKLKISLISSDNITNKNRSIVIHSRNSSRGNSHHCYKNFVEPNFPQLSQNSTPVPEKLNYLFELIKKNQTKEQPGLISLSTQKSLSDRKQDRKFRTRCCQKLPKRNSKQGFRLNMEKKECRPWSGRKSQLLLHDLTTLQSGF